MRLSFRWKIALAFTALSVLMLAAVYLYLHAAITRSTVATTEHGLLVTARVMARQLPHPPWASSSGLQSLVTELDQTSQIRLTLIDPTGTVVADSREAPASMESHANRLERLQALREGSGVAVHMSRTLKMPMIYVALAVDGPDAAKWMLRLSRPVTEAQVASQRLQQVMLVAVAIAAGLVWLLSLALAGALTRPVRHLVRVARRINKGDLQARAEPVDDPELGQLSEVFNSALDSLASHAATADRESRYYSAILQQMGDAVVIVDQGGHVEFINPVFARLFGVDVETVRGRTAEEITLNYELSSLLMRAVEQKSVQHDEVRLLHPETRQLATIVTPLTDSHGKVIGAIGLLRDVTDLQRLDEVRREFVANASHELRTPAAGIKALAEALEVGALKDPEKGPRFVHQIVQAADRLTDILDDMLTLTRVERGRELFTITRLKASEAVAEAAGQIAIANEARQIEIAVKVREEDVLSADAKGLHTVLLNLLDNAAKYTPEGGKLTVTGRTVPGGYEIAVSDTGVGIPPEHQARIFERFYRVDKARDRATGGTGLGLSIVKHLMEAHGGRVTLRSAPGSGSTFTVFFPGSA